MQTLNITNLTHPTMQAKLFAAMSRARVKSLTTGEAQEYVLNKQGLPVLRVKHYRGINGGFTFYRGNVCLKETVYKALRGE